MARARFLTTAAIVWSLLCAAACRAQDRTAQPGTSETVVAQAAAGQQGMVTTASLFQEMVDRARVARFPSPGYVTAQFSSYDRKSDGPRSRAAWYANGDYNQFLRVEEKKAADGSARKEWVLMDARGPGAVVRIWSANPPKDATLRFYLDDAAEPALAVSFQELTGGTGKIAETPVGEPLAGVRARGWNTFLPVPYAKRCVVTSDRDGFYYHVNYRTYEADTRVEPFSLAVLAQARADLERALALLRSGAADDSVAVTQASELRGGGEAMEVSGRKRGAAVDALVVKVDPATPADALRSTVLSIEFDGNQTVWCPLSDFFGSGVGLNPYSDWFRQVRPDGTMICRWVMPFRESYVVRLKNLGGHSLRVGLAVREREWQWDSSSGESMYFHAGWRREYPIQAFGGAGTKDYNYVEITGKGVYVGDNLSIMNPVTEWWGEGDEKVFVDGEIFPSHFGTGTEDYYGYAWCCPARFESAFHAQPRVDGEPKGNNYGHTAVTRVRSLDAIPFWRSLKFDMEVWHWKECEVEYASTAYWYAVPGSLSNLGPQEQAAAEAIPGPLPLPAPARVPGALECERMVIKGSSVGLPVLVQDHAGVNRTDLWSDGSQLWVQGRRPGDYVEMEVPVGDDKPRNVILRASKSWDYAIVRFSINGTKVIDDVDLCSLEPKVSMIDIDLGSHTPKAGTLILRAEVVGSNPKSTGTKSFFGLDYLMLEPPK